MTSKPFVALSSPVALGAALLGVSASLLALDVTGTVLLDRIRSADAIARATVAAAPAAVASVTSPASSSVASAAHQAIVPGIAAPRTLVLVPRSVVTPPTRSRAKPAEKAVVRRNGTDLTLLGAKARALPYRIVASSGGVLRP